MELLVLVACLAIIAAVGWRRPQLLRHAALLAVVGLATAIAAGIAIGLLLRR